MEGGGGRRHGEKFATRGVSRKFFYSVTGLVCFRPGLERKGGERHRFAPLLMVGMSLSEESSSLSSRLYDEGQAYVVRP